METNIWKRQGLLRAGLSLSRRILINQQWILCSAERDTSQRKCRFYRWQTLKQHWIMPCYIADLLVSNHTFCHDGCLPVFFFHLQHHYHIFVVDFKRLSGFPVSPERTYFWKIDYSNAWKGCFMFRLIVEFAWEFRNHTLFICEWVSVCVCVSVVSRFQSSVPTCVFPSGSVKQKGCWESVTPVPASGGLMWQFHALNLHTHIHPPHSGNQVQQTEATVSSCKHCHTYNPANAHTRGLVHTQISKMSVRRGNRIIIKTKLLCVGPSLLLCSGLLLCEAEQTLPVWLIPGLSAGQRRYWTKQYVGQCLMWLLSRSVCGMSRRGKVGLSIHRRLSSVLRNVLEVIQMYDHSISTEG